MDKRDNLGTDLVLLFDIHIVVKVKFYAQYQSVIITNKL